MTSDVDTQLALEQPRQSRLSRWGFPDLTGQGRFVTANVIDAFGNGLLLAFQVVFFVEVTSVSLVTIGAALTLAQFLALPTAMVTGPMLDRMSARTVATIANSISALGFAGFLFVHAPWQIVIAATVTQVGSTMYWTSSSALVVLAAREGERTRWFGFLRALRNIGNGVGGGLAVVAVAAGGIAGLRGLVVANILSFAIAANLLARWRPPRHADKPSETISSEAAGRPQPSYLEVMKDGRYLRLVAVNLSFVYAAMVLSVLLAVYITAGLHRGAWIAGTLVVVNTSLVALTQTAASRRIERWRPTRVLAWASLLNAAAFALFAILGIVPVWMTVAGMFVAIVIYTVSEILACSPINELSVALAPDHARGRYLAVYQLSWTVGGLSAPWLLTSLLSRGAALPWMFLLVISLLAVPVVLTLDRRPLHALVPAAGHHRHGSWSGSGTHAGSIAALPGGQRNRAAQHPGDDDPRNLARRWLGPGPEARHRADLVRSVTAARVMAMLTAVAAVVIAAALYLRGRQLEAAVVGLAGVTTALVADALLRWIGWQVQRSIEADALDRRATRTTPVGRQAGRVRRGGSIGASSGPSQSTTAEQRHDATARGT
jgi:MFS family permease